MKNQIISAIGSEKTEKLLLFLIILTGTVLRFWNYTNMPFMHDELSALSRLEFDSLRDVIKYGVMLGDTHPAGVQVFLYLWTAIGGTGEMWVKLPFIISGIVSIWLSYKIGKLWFDGTTGLLTATMLATTQFFVMYSQIARPYASGLLITLAMVYMLSLYFFKEKKRKYLILYVAFSALAAYNHYFSLLFAAIVGLSGLFFLKNRKDIITLFIAGISIFLLYLPHLDIFFSQFAKGNTEGVGGWLDKPEPIFIRDFISYLMQFSGWTWLALGLVIVLMISINGKTIKFDSSIKKRLILIFWFLLPIIIGYGYSVIKTPIIQYSMLIFSTPYIFMVMFSFSGKIKPMTISIAVLLLLIVNSLVLIVEREHYEIFYHQPYQELYSTAIIDNSHKEVFVIDDCVPYYNEYYMLKYNREVSYLTKRNSGITNAEFIDVVKNIKEETVVTQGLTGEELLIIQNEFPYITGHKQGFTYDVFTFSKSSNNEDQTYEWNDVSSINFETASSNWKYSPNLVKQDADSVYFYQMHDGSEWGPSIVFEIDEIPGEGIIDIEAVLMMPDSVSKVLLVGSLDNDFGNIFWRSANLEEYNPQPGKYSKIFLSIDLQEALKKHQEDNSVRLQINIWNINKRKLDIRSIKIWSRSGNPIKYRLYTEF